MSYELCTRIRYKHDQLTKAWANALKWMVTRPDHFDVYGSIAADGGQHIYTFLGVKFPVAVRPVIWNLNDVLLEITLGNPDLEGEPVAVWYSDGNLLFSRPPAVVENQILNLSGPTVEHFWEMLSHAVISSPVFAPFSRG